MRNRRCIAVLIAISILLTGCGQAKDNITEVTTTEIATTEKKVVNKLQIGKIQEICELVTLKCQYHNVAKSVKEPGTGIAHLGEKERVFWIEYVGEAEISFRAGEIRMEQDGTDVTVWLPRPQVTCHVLHDRWNDDSYVMSTDQVIQKNPITAEDQTKAIGEAERLMKEKIENNSSLLMTAKEQAKDIIEEYIVEMGKIDGVTYNITWKE
ncbi:MAG: DUF4230 domain-containing protein [Lachnospiraceae bacterium]|jgi:hypothetical protein|nr:DUF4230 domain-containing protein [Lachnospiraceae bacterium]